MPGRNILNRTRLRLMAVLFSIITALGIPQLASAHDAPEGSEWILADWMFLSFVVFAGAAFAMFLITLKLGLLSNLEDAKYAILDIEEEDYYTPDWAKEDDENDPA